MSLNWVMLARNPVDGYVPLPHEITVYRAPQRTSFKLRLVGNQSSSTSSMYPGNLPTTARPVKLDASQGRLILTSHRVIYLPDSPSSVLQSFAAPLRNVYDAHVTQPWFGPNMWSCVVVPVQDGGLPNGKPCDITITFKDGGAFEFHECFERIRERMQEGINHIDELPTYSAPSYVAPASTAPIAATINNTTTSVPAEAVVNDEPPPYDALG
ncbi:hypothetical protein V1520DRAFT_333756 [Lipomyces starkeyi]|uniref:Uncharacterized protein n=1 Tax=Lipomyces starkeyi NRRL Y-11557 TaxID=675824 RepID=A0A1E3QDY7_LIPST|nr:hypothetical protein LIPSTDRAFT_68307 [Lipomyces starkeyi NRRL Y-11557]